MRVKKIVAKVIIQRHCAKMNDYQWRLVTTDDNYETISLAVATM